MPVAPVTQTGRRGHEKQFSTTPGGWLSRSDAILYFSTRGAKSMSTNTPAGTGLLGFASTPSVSTARRARATTRTTSSELILLPHPQLVSDFAQGGGFRAFGVFLDEDLDV